MLKYINEGTTSDVATESLDKEIREARLKEEWRSEYMLTLVHDKDVYRDGFDDGYESRQSEFDALTKTLADKDAELERLKKELAKYKNQ